MQFKLHRQLIQICDLSGLHIQTNATDSKCEITGCKNTARQNIFPPLHSPLLHPRSISLNEMQRAITHYPINWSRHLTIYTALGSANYPSGLSVGSQWNQPRCIISWLRIHAMPPDTEEGWRRAGGEPGCCLRARYCCLRLAGRVEVWSLTTAATQAAAPWGLGD